MIIFPRPLDSLLPSMLLTRSKCSVQGFRCDVTTQCNPIVILHFVTKAKARPHDISEEPSEYLKAMRYFGFQKELFRISKLAVLYVFVLEIQNVWDF